MKRKRCVFRPCIGVNSVYYVETVSVLAWGLQYTLLSAITKLPTVNGRLHTVHLMHCLWSTLLSKLHFSMWYTVVPHTAHLSTWAYTEVFSWLTCLVSGSFFSVVPLNVLRLGWGSGAGLCDSPSGLAGTLGFSLTRGVGLLSALVLADAGVDEAPVATFNKAWNERINRITWLHLKL